ncbi:hypothetical protein H8F21_27135 [Pseudomonas sp. P66]|jgi:putative acetyltransferase|uniref:Uncharacterized protein n=1 Tax=Pseudomonas arcuscaelestis TaxID=2710591 RepID=A0ABS2C696_9PSED|nr:hypothetical protein [Pseudomonas arcuscaelestis]MBM3113631.1 hypothetical protein [Pseudomonas arcuscaelestis]MBM5461240.1 hypothetical protein [Pseudomonas arcuscaelestis]
MKEASPAIPLQPIEPTEGADKQPALALYLRHDFDVEGQLLDYAMHEGRLSNVHGKARHKPREH